MTEAPVRGRSMSILVHADTKVGKSTFGNTAPAPRLLLDVEAAYRFLPGEKTFWDPIVDAPPVADGSWETCVVLVRDYATFTRTLEWLQSGQHPFTSVIIDSISELQTKCKDQISGDGAMSIRLWGELLTHMERVVRAFRDLTEHPSRPLRAVVITAMTSMTDNKWRPYVQGKLQVKLPYFLDVIMYLYVEEEGDPNDPTAPKRKVRKGLTVPHPQIEAGERVQGRLPEIIVNPTVTSMLESVFGTDTNGATE